jgi:WXG100 family type VII secretion target
MSDQIRLNYPAMEEMVKHFRNVAQKLNDTQQLALKIAAGMADGALVGDTGDQFSEALNSHFTPALRRLQDKFVELSQDVQSAMNDMRDADKSAGSNF